MSYTLSGYYKMLKDPNHTTYEAWKGWKKWFDNYSKNQMANLYAQEGRANSQFSAFLAQSADQLESTVRQIKFSVVKNAVSRGLAWSTIPGAVIGSETARASEQNEMQNDAAKSNLDMTVKALQANRVNLRKQIQNSNNLDNSLKSLEKDKSKQDKNKDDEPDLLSVLLGHDTVDYSKIGTMIMQGASKEDIAKEKKKLDDKQAKINDIKKWLQTRDYSGYQKELEKWLTENNVDTKGLDRNSTEDTVGNRLYWNALVSFNSIVDVLKSSYDKKADKYNDYQNLKANNAAYEAVDAMYPNAPDAPGTFEVETALKSNGLIKDNKFSQKGIGDFTKAYNAQIEKAQKENARLMNINPKDKNDNDYYKNISVLQADWESQGYHYDVKDPDDLRRQENGLPPKSFLILYSDTPEDRDRLREGKPPAKLEATKEVAAEVDSFKADVAQLAQEGRATSQAIEDLYSKYPAIQALDNKVKFQNYAKSVQGAPIPPQVLDAINKQASAGSVENNYVMQNLRSLGFEEGLGFEGVKDEIIQTFASPTLVERSNLFFNKANVPKPNGEDIKNDLAVKETDVSRKNRFKEDLKSGKIAADTLRSQNTTSSSYDTSFIDNLLPNFYQQSSTEPENSSFAEMEHMSSGSDIPTNEEYVTAVENNDIDTAKRFVDTYNNAAENGKASSQFKPLAPDQEKRLAMARVGYNHIGWKNLSPIEKNIIGYMAGIVNDLSALGFGSNFNINSTDPDKRNQAALWQGLDDAAQRDAPIAYLYGKGGFGFAMDALSIPRILVENGLLSDEDAKRGISPAWHGSYSLLDGWTEEPEFTDIFSLPQNNPYFEDTPLNRARLNAIGKIILDPMTYTGFFGAGQTTNEIRSFNDVEAEMAAEDEVAAIRNEGASLKVYANEGRKTGISSESMAMEAENARAQEIADSLAGRTTKQGAIEPAADLERAAKIKPAVVEASSDAGRMAEIAPELRTAEETGALGDTLASKANADTLNPVSSIESETIKPFEINNTRKISTANSKKIIDYLDSKGVSIQKGDCVAVETIKNKVVDVKPIDESMLGELKPKDGRAVRILRNEGVGFEGKTSMFFDVTDEAFAQERADLGVKDFKGSTNVGGKDKYVPNTELTEGDTNTTNSLPDAPIEAYNRRQHYGNTPTLADRRAIGGESVDHNPSLVYRYYEGDPSIGEKPGYLMTEEERITSAQDRSRMRPSTKGEQNSQGGRMSNYSKEMKKRYGLE